jgi:hypothetical protein
VAALSVELAMTYLFPAVERMVADREKYRLRGEWPDADRIKRTLEAIRVGHEVVYKIALHDGHTEMWGWTVEKN